jgi:hypothetical protein
MKALAGLCILFGVIMTMSAFYVDELVLLHGLVGLASVLSGVMVLKGLENDSNI